jgi:glycosyltransferase involved in cell wall biosynthesis
MNCVTPKVSVCVVTYNQEHYIRECLQSIVDQKTNFDFEIIVGDDCSTDGTRTIVREFVERYPWLVTSIFHGKNIGCQGNYLSVHNKALGRYIAHLDGDDYALPGKLQKQSDFLDRHPECNIVWHRVLVKNGKTGEVRPDLLNVKLFPQGGFTRSDIIRHIAIASHSSKMYRSANRAFDIPDFPLLDWLVNIEQVQEGRACYVGDEILGVYRSGVGIASAGLATRIHINATFRYCLKKFKKHRLDVNAGTLLMFLADLKHWRPTAWLYFKTFLYSFHPLSIPLLVKERPIWSMLRLPF